MSTRKATMQVLSPATAFKRSITNQRTQSFGIEECVNATNGHGPADADTDNYSESASADGECVPAIYVYWYFICLLFFPIHFTFIVHNFSLTTTRLASKNKCTSSLIHISIITSNVRLLPFVRRLSLARALFVLLLPLCHLFIPTLTSSSPRLVTL
jgi:hypothetical protein